MKLKDFMKKKGWSYRQLSDHLNSKGVKGTNYATLNRYVNGTRKPDIKKAGEISKALNNEVAPHEICS